ncbi:DUF4262 domain-containing protein [uncultured Paludibaculum sp.]|uniref:DUF4262 domain-containing protein n=1 Tax=uncultured Paludibaculum sp. TaxID=1765020 RepID=UPI00374D5538
MSKLDESTISNIEEYGCSIVHVAPTHHGSGWSYSLGVFDTCGGPEIITVGLPHKTAQFAINGAVALLRSGVDLTIGRHTDLVGEVECEFRPVEEKWVAHLMSWAGWYYEGTAFPVLQAVYPDLENRFPWEPGFDVKFVQPLMQAGAPITRVEDDFWASADPDSVLFDWKFEDLPHTQVFLSTAVNSGIEPITYVSHDMEDGAWQFLGDSMSDSGGVLSCLHHPLEKDHSLIELADLPLGWYAERERRGVPWIRKPRSQGEPS